MPRELGLTWKYPVLEANWVAVLADRSVDRGQRWKQWSVAVERPGAREKENSTISFILWSIDSPFAHLRSHWEKLDKVWRRSPVYTIQKQYVTMSTADRMHVSHLYSGHSVALSAGDVLQAYHSTRTSLLTSETRWSMDKWERVGWESWNFLL